MSERIPLDHARDLIARGLSPIPVPHMLKGPRINGWQTLRLASEDLPRHFNGEPSNIGTLLGERAGWIVDVDLDHPLAVELADSFLPVTGMVWGRESKPRSHRLYRLKRPADTRKWQSKARGMIVELRSTGCQTIAPGSIHPSGEVVRWDEDGDPAAIDPDELISALESLACAVRCDLGEGPQLQGAPAPSPLSPVPHGASNYGRDALRREAASVAATHEGARNETLNRAAFKVGTLVGGGEIDRADAEAELLAAAQTCGLPDAEARRTIASGIDAGIEHPRQRPAQASSPNRAGDANKSEAVAASSPPAPAFAPIAACDLIRDYPLLRPPVIDGFLRRGEVMNVVAAPKIGKSWLVHWMAIAVSTGLDWLGRATTAGAVLLIDGELHRETLAQRLRMSAGAMALDPAALKDLSVVALRGKRLTVNTVAEEMKRFPPGTFVLVVVDALYRFMPIDGEENSNETMTQVYNTLDALAATGNASVVVVHHTSKGNQSGRSVTDVGAGAGAQSRAADTHMIIRPHEEEGAVVIDAVVRSWKAVDPFVVRWTDPGWALAPDLSPKDIKKSPRGNRPAEKDGAAANAERKWSPAEFAKEVVGTRPLIRDEIIARAEELGLSKSKCDSLLKRALDAEHVYRHPSSHSAHRFGTIAPASERHTEDEGGGAPAAPQAPVLSAPGGVGGLVYPPSPLLPPLVQGKRQSKQQAQPPEGRSDQ